MPKSDRQKLKVLYILDYLRRNSGPNRPISSDELLEMLARHGIDCSRKTVYADIRSLQDYGAEISAVRGKGGGFYADMRHFSLPELKLLVDAVQSSRFLTETKSRELIRKLCAECSEDEARLIRREVIVSGRVKSMNESIYANVDAIQEAISRNRKITFRYFDWDLQVRRRYRDRDYLVSPYGLCQDNENCYLLAHSQRHGVSSFRVDRMDAIGLAEEARTPCPELEGPAIRAYAGQLFQMFSGDTATVKLRFHNSLTNAAVDRFGRDLIMIPDGDFFLFTAQVAVSPLFLSWIIGFGEKAKILYPDWVAERCAALCRSVLAQYRAEP